MDGEPFKEDYVRQTIVAQKEMDVDCHPGSVLPDELPLMVCPNGALLKRHTDAGAGVCLGMTWEFSLERARAHTWWPQPLYPALERRSAPARLQPVNQRAVVRISTVTGGLPKTKCCL